MYARLRNDTTTAKWHFKSRSAVPGYMPPIPPMTVVYNEIRQDGKGRRIRLTSAMKDFLKAINGENYKICIGAAVAWVDTLSSGVLEALALSFGQNAVEVIEVDGLFTKIKAVPRSTILSADAYDFQKTPTVVQKFTAITRTGACVRMAGGKDVYSVLLCQDGQDYVWIETGLLEMFPSLSRPVQANLLGNNIHAEPVFGSQSIGVITSLKWFTITEYKLTGGQVWGRMAKGWVLLHNPKAWPVLRYTTSWRMKTSPPPDDR